MECKQPMKSEDAFKLKHHNIGWFTSSMANCSNAAGNQTTTSRRLVCITLSQSLIYNYFTHAYMYIVLLPMLSALVSEAHNLLSVMQTTNIYSDRPKMHIREVYFSKNSNQTHLILGSTLITYKYHLL